MVRGALLICGLVLAASAAEDRQLSKDRWGSETWRSKALQNALRGAQLRADPDTATRQDPDKPSCAHLIVKRPGRHPDQKMEREVPKEQGGKMPVVPGLPVCPQDIRD